MNIGLKISILGALLLSCAGIAKAQTATNPPVLVTLRLDRSSLQAGGETTLRAFARIDPALAATADQIFSWNVDLLALDGAVAGIDPLRLARAASDRDPDTSSGGVPDGSDLRGIRDTFLNRPAAGLGEPVELFSVPVLAVSSGTARFRLAPGASGIFFDSDFLVVPKDDSPALTGGNYQEAFAVLTVGSAPEGPTLQISVTPEGRIKIEFDTAAGAQYSLESRDGWGAQQPWQAFPGGAVNAGRFTLEIHNSGGVRFFRALQQAP